MTDFTKKYFYSYKLLISLQEKITERKSEITDLIRENTKRLNNLSHLLDNKHNSEGSLDSRQKSLVSYLYNTTRVTSLYLLYFLFLTSFLYHEERLFSRRHEGWFVSTFYLFLWEIVKEKKKCYYLLKQYFAI